MIKPNKVRKGINDRKSDFLSGYVAGNEFGIDEVSGHVHIAFRTRNRTTFQEFKYELYDLYKLKIHGIERVSSVRAAVRYVTKEDPNSVVVGFDKGYCSVSVKAKYYAKNHDFVVWSDCQIERALRVLWSVNMTKQKDRIIREMEGVELRNWQKELRDVVLRSVGERRAVVWIVDEIGNSGKSYFADYMMQMHNAQVFDKSAVALEYKCKPVVLFDVPGDGDNSSFKVIDILKTGTIFSTKYMSCVKRFTTPGVCVLTNSFPEKFKLSLDRWAVYRIRDNELQQLKYFNDVLDCGLDCMCK